MLQVAAFLQHKPSTNPAQPQHKPQTQHKPSINPAQSQHKPSIERRAAAAFNINHTGFRYTLVSSLPLPPTTSMIHCYGKILHWYWIVVSRYGNKYKQNVILYENTTTPAWSKRHHINNSTWKHLTMILNSPLIYNIYISTTPLNV